MFYKSLAKAIGNSVSRPPLVTSTLFGPLPCFVRVQRPSFIATAARNMDRPLPKDPLVWIDCEMTGLDLSKDRILEIAVCPHFSIRRQGPYRSNVQVIITDGDLNPVDGGIEYVIKTDKEVLDR